MREILGACLLAGAMAAPAAAESMGVEQGPAAHVITLAEALRRARERDPAVAAAVEGVRAAEALTQQAAARPNPTLDLQLEDFGGAGPVSGVNSAEATWSLTQPIELGGDRHARTAAAAAGTKAARLRAGLSELDLIEAIGIAFAEAQAADVLKKLAEARVVTARELSSAVDRRVREARDPEAARSRVAARLAEAETEKETAAARADAARAALASYWGGSADFAIETVTFFAPATRGVTGEIASPDVALAEAEREAASAAVIIERAKRIPDPSVRAGIRQLRAIDENAFIVGVSVPLPIWNRNAGAIAAARANERQAEHLVAARERDLARETAHLASQAASARAEIAAYRDRIIPASERALSQSLGAYRAGGLSYVEVLEAQSALALARERQIAALLSLHRAEARLARRRGVTPHADNPENFE